MKSSMIASKISVLVLVAFLLSGIGCASTAYKKFDVNVALDPAYPAGVPVPVDIIALGGDRAAELESIEMRKYWALNDPFRAGLIASGELWTAELSSADASAKLKASDAAFWNSKTWKSGGKLFVLANLRGVGAGPTGDPRRRTILRDAALWDQKIIDVTVKPSGITYTPTEKDAAR